MALNSLYRYDRVMWDEHFNISPRIPSGQGAFRFLTRFIALSISCGDTASSRQLESIAMLEWRVLAFWIWIFADITQISLKCCTHISGVISFGNFGLTLVTCTCLQTNWLSCRLLVIVLVKVSLYSLFLRLTVCLYSFLLLVKVSPSS